MSLPLKPPLQPQLARSAKELPEGEDWRYEPKFDGFRTIVFRDGDDVQLQSRNGRPMNRYFPDVVEQVLELPNDRLVLDGEMMVVVDGVQEFDLLSQRIHPAASRVERLRKETPASLVAFDLLAEDDEALLSLPYDERRERLRAVVADPVQLTPMTPDRDAAGEWLTGLSEGVVAKQGDAPYRPGERTGMVKIKRLRTADAVVAAFRFGKEEGTVGSLILGMYDDDGAAPHRGPHLGIPRQAEARAARPARALPDRRARRGRAEPLEVRGGARLGGPPPRARGRDRLRPHHRQPHTPRREVHALARRQGSERVQYLAAAFLILLLLVPATPAAAQAQPEVYASGMRNPYRWSFDRQTGDLYVGDVGGTNEEITFIPAAQGRGANLGWNCFSGTAVESGCTPSNYFPPAYQYPSGPDVVIGGYLVRDPSLPSFAGQYLFGRFDTGIIMKLGPQAAPPPVNTGLNVAERLRLRRGRRGPPVRDLARGTGLPARRERRDAHEDEHRRRSRSRSRWLPRRAPRTSCSSPRSPGD